MTNLERFKLYCQDLPSPDLLVEADFLFLIAAALGRRVWVGQETEAMIIFPNQFSFKITPPGIGKSAISGVIDSILRSCLTCQTTHSGQLIDKVPMIQILPNTTSPEKLLFRLANSVDRCLYRDQGASEVKKYYMHTSAVYLLTGELDTLLRENKSQDIVTFLTDGWDCRDHPYDTHTHGEKVIVKPCLNFSANATREKIQRMARAGLFNEGLAARTVFFCADKKKQGIPEYKFEFTEAEIKAKTELSAHVKLLAALPAGPLKLTPAAKERLYSYVGQELPKEIISNVGLEQYYERKKVHLVKYAIAYHFGEKLSPEIDIYDVESAITILRRSEQAMGYGLLANDRNPVYVCAQQIKTMLKENGGTWIDILKKLSHTYNEKMLNEGLRLVEKIGEVKADKSMTYRLTNGSSSFELAEKTVEEVNRVEKVKIERTANVIEVQGEIIG